MVRRVRTPVRTPARRSEAGHALLNALFVLLLVALALALVAQALNLALGGVRQEMRGIRLAALTDAALAEAVAHLAADSAFTGLPEHELGGGTLASEVRRLGALSWRVEATARTGGITRSVRATVVAVEEADGDRNYRISGWRVVGGTLPP